MTKYYKITCSNGYCGCNEDYYEKIEDGEDIDNIASEYLDCYSFHDPDGRFCDMENEEDVENYYDNLMVDYQEITKGEYQEYGGR